MHESESESEVAQSSLWPHGLQPTRLLLPWDFPGKSTGVGCHSFSCLCSRVAQTWLHEFWHVLFVCLHKSQVFTLYCHTLTVSQLKPRLWFQSMCSCCHKLFLDVCSECQWHPTPVLLPGKSHGRRSLVGCSPWGRKESDTTESLHFHFSLSYIGQRNGNPCQCSCLENPRNGRAWWAAVYGVAQSRTRLKWLSRSIVDAIKYLSIKL